MAVQETNPPRNVMIGYRELAAFAVTILVIVGAIMGAMQWAVATAVTPLREETRALREETRTLSGRVDAGFAESRSELRGELTAVRNELTDLRKDINDLSNRVTRIETILEQQRQGTTAPDTP